MQVAGESAAFTNVTMAISGNRGVVVNQNNAFDAIDVKGCTIAFASGMDRAFQTWNGTGDSLLTVADSTVTGVGHILMFADGDTGDTTCFITNSTVSLTASQIESHNGDATVEISESTVSMTGGSNNKNGAFNVGARYGAETTASVKILNNSNVTCSGQYSGINVWTWGENGPQESNVFIVDSTYNGTGSYYGLSAYSIYDGDTYVYFANSTVNASGAISAIEMCSDPSYNALGNKEYVQIDSDVTLTTTTYGYGLDLDNSTSGSVNGSASNTATITGGSLACNGCGILVTGDDDANSSVTIHDAEVAIDVSAHNWYTIATGELSIDSGSYGFTHAAGRGILVAVGNITGGIFSEDVSDLCATGYVCSENTDEATAEDYPFAVVPAVASITIDDETYYYATFEHAVDDAELSEEEVTITVINYNAETMVAPEGWEFSTDTSVEPPVTTLVRAANAAQIVRGGEVFEQYQTLAEAIAAAIDGDTVELLRNVQLSGAEIVSINKVGTYVIDGKGFSITPAASTEFAYHRFLFGESGQSYDPTRSYTVKDLTINGFADSAYLVRAEGCSLTLKDCVLENNNLPYYSENDVETHTQNGSRVALATSADLTIDGCVFRNNTTTFQTVDFNTNGGNPNVAAGTFTVDDCLFADNAVIRGSGVIYTLGSTSADNVVSRSTFSGNSVTSTAGAVIYFSGVTDVTGCFFTNNIVNVSADNKCGVFALGSQSAGSSLTGNAFVDNEVSSVGAAATVYGGAKNVDLSGNYWDDGAKPDVGDGVDIYLTKSEGVVYGTYADTYTVWGNGVTVTIYEPSVEVTVDVGDSGSAVISKIKVSETWLEENGLSADSDTDNIMEALEKTDANGLPAWQNYVIGVNPDGKVAVDAEQGRTTDMPVVSTIEVPKNDTGFDVSFSLDRVTDAGVVIDHGTPQPSPEFMIDLSSIESTAYFQLNATVTSKDETGASVTVKSANTMGVLKVESSSRSTILGVPWAALAGGSISVSNLVRTATLTDGDKLQLFANGQVKSWTLSNGVWTPDTTVGDFGTVPGTPADEATVARGNGVWLTRSDPTKPIYLAGGLDTAAAPVTLEKAESETKASWNLIAPPTAKEVDLKDVIGGNTDDQIVVPTAGAPKNYSFVDGVLGYPSTEPVYDKDGNQIGVRAIRKTDTKLPPGTGCFYLNKDATSESKQIVW